MCGTRQQASKPASQQASKPASQRPICPPKPNKQQKQLQIQTDSPCSAIQGEEAPEYDGPYNTNTVTSCHRTLHPDLKVCILGEVS